MFINTILMAFQNGQGSTTKPLIDSFYHCLMSSFYYCFMSKFMRNNNNIDNELLRESQREGSERTTPRRYYIYNWSDFITGRIGVGYTRAWRVNSSILFITALPTYKIQTQSIRQEGGRTQACLRVRGKQLRAVKGEALTQGSLGKDSYNFFFLFYTNKDGGPPTPIESYNSELRTG